MKKEATAKDFEVTGEFEEKGKKKPFTIIVNANSANYAIEKASSILGSKHKKPRRKIFFREAKEYKEEKKR